MIGSVISHYRIIDQLGRGGMGIVYKAEDTKLDRIVALKVLPTAALASEDDRARFYREAKAAAALHHPNIATIFGIDEGQVDDGEDSQPFIAMEFVDGQTLAERIVQGPLPIRDAVAIAVQITEGLKAAHDKGIVHRDIKTGNVMLREDGRAKILDFGLAMTAASTRLTQLGSTLGTAAYMSPEQARGEEVDHRADLWSLGVVLYEMLTGRLPFPGDYEQAIVYGILNANPEPVTGLRTGVPMELERIVTKLLAKDRARRYQNAADLIVDLESVDIATPNVSSVSAASTVVGNAPGAVSGALPEAARRRTAWHVWLPVALTLFVAGLAAGRFFMRTPDEAPLRKYQISMPELQGSQISPDGEHVAAAAGGALWIRSLSDLNRRRIVDSSAVRSPFWSPASDQVGYLSSGKLYRVSVSGGTPVEICDVPFGGFVRAMWAPDGSIYIMVATGGASAEVFEVSSQGGTARSYLGSAEDEDVYTYLDMGLMDAGRILLSVVPATSGGPSILAVGADGEMQSLHRSDGGFRIGSPLFSPSGHILFEWASTVWAISLSGGEAAEPFRIATDAVSPSVSLGGTLLYHSREGGPRSYGQVYRAAGSSAPSELVWVDRAGNQVGLISDVEEFAGDPVVSRDGSKVVVEVGRDLWLYGAKNDFKSRLTYDDVAFPSEWVPNTDDLLYARLSSGRGDIRVIETDGTGKSYDLIATPAPEFGPTISADGKYLVYHVIDPDTQRDLYWTGLDTSGDSVRIVGTPQPLVKTPYDEAIPSFSPDGRYVAFHANRSGRWEIYLTRFPGGLGEWTVSTNGGNVAYWNPQGGELFYADPDGNLMSVSIDTSGDTPRIGRPVVLFNATPFGHGLINGFHNSFYCPRPDGQAFALVRFEDGDELPTLTVVENWNSEFGQK
jgi:hypothetical protein